MTPIAIPWSILSKTILAGLDAISFGVRRAIRAPLLR